MRSVASLVACSLLAGPLRAYADRPSAASFFEDARALAARGHCDEALRLRPVIERLDPELARTRFDSDPAIAACLAGTAPPPASAVVLDDGNPPAGPRPTEPATSTSQGASTSVLVGPQRCIHPYLDASVLDMPGAAFLRGFNRVAAGALLQYCDAPWQVRLGATAYIGQVGQAGAGAEGEATERMSELIRVGLHVAYESAAGGSLGSIDFRIHVDDLVWLQAGAYRWSRSDEVDGFPPGVDIGFAAGVGVEGKPGAIIGAAELGAGALFLLLALSVGFVHV